MTTQNHYTFGDSTRAGDRLSLLARAFEEPSRALIERFRPQGLERAIDLGAGPGHTTRLLHAASRARCTIGVEASEKYLLLAREQASPDIQFVRDDVTAPAGVVAPAALVFCRFVLTHVQEPAAAVRAFASYVAPAGVLLLQETAHLESSNEALARYYELVGQLQAHYGQTLYIGQELPRLAQGAPLSVVHSEVRRFERPARLMAELHVQNLRTWRTDSFASQAFDAQELSDLECRLQAIADGSERAGSVSIGLGELALR